MRIERIRIDKFGGLRGFEAELDEGLTVLLGGNESGKTTVCAFIRAMLYGLNGKSASLAQNERKKYMPWGETAMGGSLRMVSGKERYEIVRVFGQTKKSDSVRLVNADTGEIMPIPAGQEPGEVLLGLEESVFLDTLYVSFRGGRISGGAELTERIRNRMDTGEEHTDLVRVQERLMSARNAIAPRMREKGALAQVRRELDEARRRLMREETLKQETAHLEAMLNNGADQERAAALAHSAKQLENRIREQEDLLLMQEKQERTDRKAVWLPVVLAVVTAAASIGLGLWVSGYAFAGLLPAAGFAAWAFVSLSKKRKAQRRSVDAVLKGLSELRQDQVMLRQQAALLQGADTDDELLRRRLALEKTKQELAQLEKIKLQVKTLELQEDALLTDVQALDMALEALSSAAKERREGLAPQIRRDMEDMLCALTGARYAQAALSEEMALSLQTEGGELREDGYFSGGTAEQMYLALRLSLIKQLERTHGALPVLLDDPLSQYDDERAADALELLRGFAQGRQVILMTCRARDAKGAGSVLRMERHAH